VYLLSQWPQRENGNGNGLKGILKARAKYDRPTQASVYQAIQGNGGLSARRVTHQNSVDQRLTRCSPKIEEFRDAGSNQPKLERRVVQGSRRRAITRRRGFYGRPDCKRRSHRAKRAIYFIVLRTIMSSGLKWATKHQGTVMRPLQRFEEFQKPVDRGTRSKMVQTQDPCEVKNISLP